MVSDIGSDEMKSGYLRKLGWPLFFVPRGARLHGLSPRSPPSAASEGRSRALFASGGRRLMGTWGSVGPGGVTLQFVIARGAHGARSRRCGSSTSLAAEGGRRGSLVRVRRSGDLAFSRTPPVSL